MGILKIIFVILLLLFPLGQIARFEFQNDVAVTLSDIAVGVVVLVFLFANRSKQRFKKSLVIPIIIFAVIGLLSLIVNKGVLNTSEFIISLFYGIRWILYAGIFFVVSGFDPEFKKIITKVMLFIGSLVVLVGYLQYFLYPNLRNLYYLGWDEHLYRMFSSFLDPNFAASIISLFLILLLALLLSRSIKSKKITIFLIVLSILSFIAILLTYSRSGYLMFFVSAVSLLLMFGKKKYVVILLLVFVIGIILLPKNLGGEGVKLLRTASLISRSQYLNNAIIIFRDHPVLGVGFNSYRYAQHRYGFIDDISLKTSHAGSGTDNSFLFVLATTGIVGFTAYIYMWFKILKSCHPELVSGSFGMLNLIRQAQSLSDNRRQVQHDTKKEGFQKTISIVILASSIGIFVNAFFINSLFYPSIMLWMWVLIGLRDNSVRDPSPSADGSG